MPKGFFPQQDTGRLMGGMLADQSISFQAMEQKLDQMMDIVQHDPAVQSVVGFTGQGGGGGGGGQYRPGVRRVEAAVGAARRCSGDGATAPRTGGGARRAAVPGADPGHPRRRPAEQRRIPVHVDRRTARALLYEWAPKLLAALEKSPVLRDVNSDQQQKGLETDLHIDRATASRLGINMTQIDNTLYDAFGQRQVSTIYSAQNQYHVIMEVAPRYWQSPETLKDIYVSTSGGTASGTETTNAVVGTVPPDQHHPGCRSRAPLSSQSRRPATRQARPAAASSTTSSASSNAATAASIASSSAAQRGEQRAGQYRQGQRVVRRRGQHQPGDDGAAVACSADTRPGNTPLAVNHQGLFVATTISFNLAPGKSLERCHRGDRRRGAADRHAGQHPWQLRRHRADLPAIARTASRC